MAYKAIFFDLDGTLLPMDQEAFTKGYFKELAAVLAPLGLAPEALVEAVWAGTRAMVKNDGTQSNMERFWTCFAQVSGQPAARFRPTADCFYNKEFHKVRTLTGENPLAAQAVALARNGKKKVVLATNPLFPMDGQAARLSWIGLKPEDFDLVTAYEDTCYCKPNPQYYLDICEKMALNPADCLMVGNDEQEDMYAATAAGLDAFLVTDCRIPSAEHPWEGEKGDFAQLLEKMKCL